MYNVWHLCKKSVKKYKLYFVYYRMFTKIIIFAVNKNELLWQIKDH